MPSRTVAYFTMEVALEDALPTYSGGLGVLAGDYLRSAADLHMPLVGVSLLYREGYFRQVLDAAGHQSEEPVAWRPEQHAERIDVAVSVVIGGREVSLAAWLVTLSGVTGGTVPVYLLDSDLPENDPEDRGITDRLYGGDDRHRVRQEAVLGFGGVELLRALGLAGEASFHMNEGHSALLALALLEDEASDLEAVRARAAFTTHTPVEAGHDRFAEELVREELGAARTARLEQIGALSGGVLDMTDLALRAAGWANAVSRRHGEVARAMHPRASISVVTNGVHAATWTAPAMAGVLDRHLPGWREDNATLRYASTIPLDDLASAHAAAKSTLLDEVERRTGTSLDPSAFTLGAARRVTPYKRTTLPFSDLERLREIGKSAGPVQVICAGKAHPRDKAGKELIVDVFRAAAALHGQVEVVFLEGYDLALARLLCSGSDVWLNVPEQPNEASGTSGMKAALNCVPSLSVLDGWWVEGCVEGVTGWTVGSADPTPARSAAADLYDKLEQVVLPLFYRDPPGFCEVRRGALALNGSFFNTERMAREYARLAYGSGKP